MIKTSVPNVSCDGGDDGHPRIFLKISEEIGHIKCPYCGRCFVLSENEEDDS